MTPREFYFAITGWLASTDRGGNPNRLPHDIFPGEKENDCFADFPDAESWKAYTWNPNPYQINKHPGFDPSASGKPTYSQLRGYIPKGKEVMADDKKPELIEKFRTGTRQRICADIFEAHDLPDEIINRAAGNYTEAQEARKDAVITVYRAQRALLQAVSDVDHLEAAYEEAQAAVAAAIDNPE